MTDINKSTTATFLKMNIQRPQKFGNIRWNASSISPESRDVATSGLDTVELLDLENMSIAVRILLLCALELEI